jgi:nucleoside-diphosphate-sugar epimerase
MPTLTSSLFCFGQGYAAEFIVREFQLHGYEVYGTHRTKRPNSFMFSANENLDAVGIEKLLQSSAVLISIPPDGDGDPVFRAYAEILAQSENLKWLGYFSTTAVYGETEGKWVDEETPVNPLHARARNRVKAERQWLGTELPVHIFRLSGIYGPGRSAIDRAQKNAIVITKPSHVFNRIHVADIAHAIIKSIINPTPHEIYNLSDDLPIGGDKVLSYAYELLGMVPPAPIPYDHVDLSPTAAEFYTESKRVRADKIKQYLEIEWLYPDYKSGLRGLIT